MSERDLAISVSMNVPQGAIISKKPAHLVIMENSNKAKLPIKFIALDRPEILGTFIAVKGIYCDSSDEEIIKDFSSLLTKASKEDILEMLFPVNKVVSIRNLVFKAK